MKRFVLMFLFSIFLYGQENDSKNSNDRIKYFFGSSIGFNTTNLIDNIYNFQYETDMLSVYSKYGFYFFKDNDIYLFSVKKVSLELAWSNSSAYINKDFREEDANTQRYISIAIGLRPTKYFEVSENFSIYTSCGIEYNFNFGRSIFYDKNTRPTLIANDYQFWNIIPELGFLFSMLEKKGEVYINYIHSINGAKIFSNSENRYRLGIINIGFRTPIFST